MTRAAERATPRPGSRAKPRPRPGDARPPPPAPGRLPWGLRLWDDEPAAPPGPPQRLRRAAALVLVVLACVAARLSTARTLDVDNDEAVYTAGVGLEYAERLNAGDWRGVLACRENYEHPPFVKLVHGAAVALAGADRTPEQVIAVCRAVAVIAAGLTAALLFLLSPWAAIAFSVHGWEIYYSSKGWLDSVTVLFLVGAFVGFARARGRWGRAAILSALSLGAGVASKYVVGLFALTLLPFLVLAFRPRPRLVLAYVGIALLTFFALDPALWLDPAGSLRASLGFHQVGAGSALYQRFLERYGGDPGPFGQLVSLWGARARYQPDRLPFALDRLVLALGVLGLPLLLRRSAVLFAWFTVGALFLVLYPIKYPHYTLVFLPALALSAGEALRGGVPWLAGRVPALRERLAQLGPRLPGERGAAAIAALAIAAYGGVFAAQRWGERGDALPAYNSFAYTLGRLGRTAEAQAVFARSGQRGGELGVAAHLNLADLLLRQKKLAEARAELVQVLTVSPDSAEGHCLLGNVLLEEEKLDEAMAEYRKVDLQRLPDPGARAALHLNVGSVHLRQRRLPEARAALEQALALSPRSGDAHHLLGLVSFLQGDAAGAERELRAAIDDGVGGWKVHQDLGVACAQQRKYPEAVAAWEQALRLEPGNAETRRYLEDARRRMGR